MNKDQTQDDNEISELFEGKQCGVLIYDSMVTGAYANLQGGI